ncbi:MAG TPA: helix-turn-helix domain-containing protein [Azospirillaceae bacterium]|nr:helix-turn-helix domain-containing protein [Azospirillaceae bacterium]
MRLDASDAGAFASPALRVLAAVAAGAAGCVTDVAGRCGLPLADTFRIVRELEAAGLVEMAADADGRLSLRPTRRRLVLEISLPEGGREGQGRAAS